MKIPAIALKRIKALSLKEITEEKALFLIHKITSILWTHKDSVENLNEEKIGCVRLSRSFLEKTIGERYAKTVVDLLIQEGFLTLVRNYSNTDGLARVYRVALDWIFSNPEELPHFWEIAREEWKPRDSFVVASVQSEKRSVARYNKIESENPLCKIVLNSLNQTVHPWIPEDFQHWVKKSDYAGRVFHSFVNLPTKSEQFGNQKARLRTIDGESLEDFDMQSAYFWAAIKLFEKSNPASLEIPKLWRIYESGVYDFMQSKTGWARQFCKDKLSEYFATRSPKQRVKVISSSFPEFDSWVRGFRDKENNVALDIQLQRMESQTMEKLILFLNEKRGIEYFLIEHDGIRIRKSDFDSVKKGIEEFLTECEPKLIFKASEKSLRICAKQKEEKKNDERTPIRSWISLCFDRLEFQIRERKNILRWNHEQPKTEIDSTLENEQCIIQKESSQIQTHSQVEEGGNSSRTGCDSGNGREAFSSSGKGLDSVLEEQGVSLDEYQLRRRSAFVGIKKTDECRKEGKIYGSGDKGKDI